MFRIGSSGENGFNTAAVALPVWVAQEMRRSGVHSAYSRWDVGICSGLVVCFPFTNERGCEAIRFPLWKHSTVADV